MIYTKTVFKGESFLANPSLNEITLKIKFKMYKVKNIFSVPNCSKRKLKTKLKLPSIAIPHNYISHHPCTIILNNVSFRQLYSLQATHYVLNSSLNSFILDGEKEVGWEDEKTKYTNAAFSYARHLNVYRCRCRHCLS